MSAPAARLVRWRLELRPIVRDGRQLADGAIHYDIEVERDGETHETSTYQPFRRGPNPGPCPALGNVWGWDGDLERPTITPSFLARWPSGIRLHLFLRDGQIEMCGDSTVTLALEAS